MSVPVSGQVASRFGLRKRWTLLRHLLAGGVTVAVVTVVVLVITAPFVAVLLMSDDTSMSTFVKTYGMGVGVWISGASVGTLAIALVAVVLERFVLRGGRLRVVLAVLLPFALIVAMVGCGYVLFEYLLDSPAAGRTVEIAFGLMFLFVIYWPMLWLLNLAGYALTRLHRRARPATIAG